MNSDLIHDTITVVLTIAGMYAAYIVIAYLIAALIYLICYAYDKFKDWKYMKEKKKEETNSTLTIEDREKIKKRMGKI